MTKLELVQPNLPWVNHFYYVAFPGLIGVHTVSGKEVQKIGIDKILQMPCLRPNIGVDEKLRKESYPNDILLEEYSNWERKTLGWLMEGSAADYISYIVRPTRRIYLLPYYKLKENWDRNYKLWLARYGRKFGKTDNWYGQVLYRTSNIPVPFNELEIEFSNDPRLSCYIAK